MEACQSMRIIWIDWRKKDENPLIAALREKSLEIENFMFSGPGSLKALHSDPPAAILIDLTRLPSQGRDLGILLRKNKGTRHIPLLYLNGEQDKVDQVKSILPDAFFCREAELGQTLASLKNYKVLEPVVPDSAFAGYKDVPLLKKLGIQAQLLISLIDAPENFITTLGSWPEGAVKLAALDPRSDLTIWFVRSREELDTCMTECDRTLQCGRLWIAWPKSANKVSGLSQTLVRKTGLDAGWVDYKICAIDSDWSALLFTRRKK